MTLNSPTNSVLYFDGQQAGTGTGSTHYPDPSVRQADGMTVGAAWNGWHILRSVVDEMETFNYALSSSDIWNDYLAAFEFDEDHDGLPDWWETHHFGNLDQDAHGDYDADGWTNLQEYLDATNPADVQGFEVFTPLK